MASPSTDLPLLPLTTSETLRLAKNGLDDGGLPVCFISSYPKSGTTWTQALVYHVLRYTNPAGTKTEKEDRPFSHISDYCPFLDIQSTWDNYQQKHHENHLYLGWKVFNTHFIPSLLPSPASPSATFKYIYVMRNGIDVMKSFFHHLSNQVGDGGSYSGTMCDFLKEWNEGKLPYGEWVKHIHCWTTDLPSSFSPSSILFLRYEEMKKDLKGTLEAIAAFLNRDPLTPEILSLLLPSLSFEGMRKNEEKYHPVSVKWKSGFHFIRKGETTKGGEGVEEGDSVRSLFSSIVYPKLPPKKKVQEKGSQWRKGGEKEEGEGLGGGENYQSDVDWLDDLTRSYCSH
mmetsp:Transcript_5609/g.8484  ORF Transcript_5609/g.8484 Transcript_5609/m.8484 type:complete len:342 (-) Transcript_5609:230-1255(-)|eukprot:CAMPEP_0201531806 /NCGR_PEP_ID=MMETSP0161_2-20130828/48674_1 /ASSEMBLY_ACC=CAM_ASM_000251 /TAXON_ID=180227 /ORGANISM="Neoparamoeba aestuarina, Strain SoJaBio B1-5/56/2" /LENGTH=341 /DNA_ID=CAMNT_0047934901 /DNA_START=104 /DNA_END=1129 /DNA_ORIENTATION=-